MQQNSIVLIGAGSTVFTPGLMTDLAASPVFSGWTVHLVDLDADAAETMARLGRRIAADRRAELRFEAHTDRRRRCPDAIAGDVEDLAPGAHMVNYSNPLTANVRAITAATSVPAVGLSTARCTPAPPWPATSVCRPGRSMRSSRG